MKSKANSNNLTAEELIKQYENNVSGFEKKDIAAIYIPENLDQLKQIVSELNEEEKALFVFSTGKNWGLGSKQPVVKNSTVVDLHKLNNIIEINDQYRYAIIEPGVTQKDLSDKLIEAYPHLKFPVTGSASRTSIMGNILERGAAGFGHRNNMIVALEVLLMNGELLRTGFWHYFEDNDPNAFHYTNGVGPDLKGLFVQSNFGIVTKMVIRLQPNLNGTITLFQFKDKYLSKAVKKIKELSDQKITDDGIILTNLNDPRTAANEQHDYTGEWLGCISFSGNKRLMRVKKKVVLDSLKSISTEVFFIPTSKASRTFSLRKSSLYPLILDFIEKSKLNRNKRILNLKLKSGDSISTVMKRISVLKGYYKGIPSNYSIETMAKMNGTVLENDDIDNSSILGLSVVLTAVPIDEKAVVKIGQLVDQVSAKWNVKPYHNLASIDDLTFEGFYRIYFPRSDEKAVKTALNWNKELHEVLRRNHYFPYRLDHERMTDFIDDSSTFWQTVKKIKGVLDKKNILAKGKYNLH